MKITRDMLDEELRAAYLPAKAFGWLLSHSWGIALMNRLNARQKGAEIADLHCEERYIPSRNGGPDIRIRIYKPLNAPENLPGMLYLHGGGYVLGVPEIAADIIKDFISTSPCVIVAPDYRKAIPSPYPDGFNDCYDTLLWMQENAASLGMMPDKFIVGGHSAGGGLTAAVSLKASDTGDVNIAFQLPIYPMIDDRARHESSASDAPVWNASTNRLAWHHYLKGLHAQNADIPSYAAPARATDYSHLPPTITFVGDLEPFRDETITYVENLKQAGIPVAFALYEGCFHGFETIAKQAGISQQARNFLLTHFGQFVDTYC